MPTTETIVSHPRMRPRHKPMLRPEQSGPSKFADARKGSDSNAGTESAPFKSINHALSQLAPGDTLYLRSGTYHEHVYIARNGREGAPITVRSYPGEIAVIDGGRREFFESPQPAWELVKGKVPDYFRSTRVYPNERLMLGHFGDSMVGVLTYQHREDIEELERTTFAQVAGEPYPLPLYLGPGVWFDEVEGRLYCRLTHTNYNFESPGYADYKGVRDPRQVPMVLAPYGSLPLFLDGARHVVIQDLVVRGAGEDAMRLRDCEHITFDNVTIYCGTYGFHARSSGWIKFLNSALYGSVPPWQVHAAMSLRVYSTKDKLPDGRPPTRDVARYNTHVVCAIEGRTEEQVDHCVPGNHDWEMAYSDFTDSLDGIHLGGFHVRFHHNRIDRMADDSIYLTPLTARAMDDVHVYNNLFVRCLLGWGFGGESEPGLQPIYIYHNIMDQRAEFLWSHSRKAFNHHIVQHFRKPATFGHLCIYQNTIIGHTNPKLSDSTYQDCDRTYAQSSVSLTRVDEPRRVFNNVYVYLRGMIPPSEESLPPVVEDVQIDGNVHYDLKRPERSVAMMGAYKKSEFFTTTKQRYPAGWEANARVGDPKFHAFNADRWFVNDYRIKDGSAAAGAGVVLPAEYPDPYRPKEGKRPDAGAIPLGAEPFRAGRELDEEDIKVYEWLEKRS